MIQGTYRCEYKPHFYYSGSTFLSYSILLGYESKIWDEKYHNKPFYSNLIKMGTMKKAWLCVEWNTIHQNNYALDSRLVVFCSGLIQFSFIYAYPSGSLNWHRENDNGPYKATLKNANKWIICNHREMMKKPPQDKALNGRNFHGLYSISHCIKCWQMLLLGWCMQLTRKHPAYNKDYTHPIYIYMLH